MEVHTLEFGLQVGPNQAAGNMEGSPSTDDAAQHGGKPGDVQLRPNIATSDTDWSTVPGEVLYKFKPLYFDRAGNTPPPALQEHEKGMYEPCLTCRRIYCNCAKLRELAMGKANKAAGDSQPHRFT